MVDWTDQTEAVTALREADIETDLTDAALHAKAKSAVDEIATRLGAATGLQRFFDGWGQRFLALTPPASTITTVTEAGIPVTAGDNGYRIRDGGATLERLSTAYASVWSGPIVVTYDAAPTSGDRYDRVVIDLVKLALQYSGLDSRRDGDYAEESLGARGGGQKSYQDERDILIRELLPPDPVFA